jgi:hypothetical protein
VLIGPPQVRRALPVLEGDLLAHAGATLSPHGVVSRPRAFARTAARSGGTALRSCE